MWTKERIATALTAAAITVALLTIVGLVQARPATQPAPPTGAPSVVSYQGQVEMDSVPFDGTGYFKFAIVNAAGDTTYWSNDGTSTGGEEPTAAVSRTVTGGLFHVLLGDTSLGHMTEPLDAEAFDGTERYLRVWFSSDNATFTHLTPDRRIAAVPYALQAQEATDADTVDGEHASTFVSRHGEAYVMVNVTTDPTTNGTNLLSAYEAAATLTPHGQPLSTTNRAVVLLPPGRYDLGTNTLTLDAEYVDLEGFSSDREKQHIYGTTVMTETGVLVQTANDVRLTNLFVEIMRDNGEVNYDSTDPAAYFPEGDEAPTQIRNCRFEAMDEDHGWSMRVGITYPGTYNGTSGGTYAFGGVGGTASGTFTDCSGGAGAFGGVDSGTASGTFIDCTGGDYAFGGGDNGTASGTFIDCTGGGYAFGGGSTGTANGTFTRCSGGYAAFAGNGGMERDGVFRYSTGGENSFGTAGTYLYCVQVGATYP